MSKLEDFQKRVEQLNDDLNLFSTRKDPATLKMIAAYESGHGLKFCTALKEFLTTYGTLILEVKEEVWSRPKELEVKPAWKFGYGFFIYGLSNDKQMPKWLDFQEKFSETMALGDISLGQLFYRRSGNLYRAYTNKGIITIEHDKCGLENELFKGNVYDFLIAEIDKLESDYLLIKNGA